MQHRSKYNRIETELIETSGVVKKSEAPFNAKKTVVTYLPHFQVMKYYTFPSHILNVIQRYEQRDLGKSHPFIRFL